MDSSSDNEQNTGADSSSLTEESQLPSSTRRRFARNAAAGSVVLLSLGNRAAWGVPVDGACMSDRLIASFAPDGFLSSHHTDQESTEVSTFLEDIQKIGKGEYTDWELTKSTDSAGNPQTCFQDNSPDGDVGGAQPDFNTGPLSVDKLSRQRDWLK